MDPTNSSVDSEVARASRTGNTLTMMSMQLATARVRASINLRDLDDLRSKYSFDESELRRRFVQTAKDACYEYVLLAKHYDMLAFRLSQYDITKDVPVYRSGRQPQLQLLRAFFENVDSFTEFNIGDALREMVPGLPWIEDYFVSNAWPAIFFHFAGQEFSGLAMRFLRRFQGDPLLPRMVDSFLLHDFLFRARLWGRFLLRRASGQSEREALCLAFRACASYLTRQEREAVELLGDEVQMGKALCRLVVATVDAWRDSLFIAPGLSERVREWAEEGDFQAELCRTFSVQAWRPCPELSRFVFEEGVTFALSLLDVSILQQLSHKGRGQPRAPVAVRAQDAAAQACELVTTVSLTFIGGPGTRPPEPPSTYRDDERARLEYRRTLHDHLLNASGTLLDLRDAAAAVRSVLDLHARAVADHAFDAEREEVNFGLWLVMRFVAGANADEGVLRRKLASELDDLAVRSPEQFRSVVMGVVNSVVPDRVFDVGLEWVRTRVCVEVLNMLRVAAASYILPVQREWQGSAADFAATLLEEGMGCSAPAERVPGVDGLVETFVVGEVKSRLEACEGRLLPARLFQAFLDLGRLLEPVEKAAATAPSTMLSVVEVAVRDLDLTLVRCALASVIATARAARIAPDLLLALDRVRRYFGLRDS